jgi:hypothetical protein
MRETVETAVFDNLVFLFGSARSGTTFLAKIFESSPDALYRHEPDISRPTNDIPFLPGPASYEVHLDRTRVYAAELVIGPHRVVRLEC